MDHKIKAISSERTMEEVRSSLESLGECPYCRNILLGIANLFVFCSSYGNDLPWITDEDKNNGLTYQTKYPNGCGYMFIAG